MLSLITHSYHILSLPSHRFPRFPTFPNSSIIIAHHHPSPLTLFQTLPHTTPTPYNAPTPLQTLPIPLPKAPNTPIIPITTIVAPPLYTKPHKPIQSRRWDKPQGLAGQSQLIPSQYPLHTKSSTKDCIDNTISFNTIQIVFLYPKRIKYSYVKYILSLYK